MKRLTIIAASVFLVAMSSHWLSSVFASKLYDSDAFGAAAIAWQASKLAPFSNDTAIEFNLGNVDYQQGQYEAAITHYEKVLNSRDLTLVCPAIYNWAQSLSKLGDASLGDQQLEEAIAKYAKALSLASRQSCVNTVEFNEQFTELAEELQDKLDQAADTEESDDQEQEQPSQREIDEELEEELDNIDEEVDQLQRGNNNDRYDEVRDNDDYQVIW